MQGRDVKYSFSLSHIGLLSLLRCLEIRKRERRVDREENEKDDRKLALVRRAVAKKNNRQKLDKVRTSAEPIQQSAILNLHVPSLMPGKEGERDRRMWKGPRKWTVKKWARQGCRVQFLTVSCWFPVPSSMPRNYRENGRRRRREKK